MKNRELFEELRNQGDQKFNLKTKLVILVSIEVVLCIALSYAISLLINNLFCDKWNVPQFLELMVISLIVGVFVTRVMSRHFFDPVEHLRKAMARVADGDFEVRLNEKTSSKKIQEVYAGFNLMVNEIRTREILRMDFISAISHEFKTPINAIEGYSTLLQGDENLNDSQREYIEKIIYNSDRLSKLVSSILLLSKIENQTIPTNQSSYDLDEQIRQSIVALEYLWEKKEIEFDVDLEDVEYYGNEILMHHVWDNLISNAIKFNPYFGLIIIRLKNDEKNIVFTIEDSGTGISEEAQKRIFDKFYQEDTIHKIEGNGLGLSIVKTILALEEGDINVENIPGGGCRFTVTLKEKKLRDKKMISK